MKIITGGGGVDKDGNAYELPEDEIDVPDDFFERALEAMFKAPEPGAVIVPKWLYDEFQKLAKDV